MGWRTQNSSQGSFVKRMIWTTRTSLDSSEMPSHDIYANNYRSIFNKQLLWSNVLIFSNLHSDVFILNDLFVTCFTKDISLKNKILFASVVLWYALGKNELCSTTSDIPSTHVLASVPGLHFVCSLCSGMAVTFRFQWCGKIGTWTQVQHSRCNTPSSMEWAWNSGGGCSSTNSTIPC